MDLLPKGVALQICKYIHRDNLEKVHKELLYVTHDIFIVIRILTADIRILKCDKCNINWTFYCDEDLRHLAKCSECIRDESIERRREIKNFL
jgi:hypothetical protein